MIAEGQKIARRRMIDDAARAIERELSMYYGGDFDVTALHRSAYAAIMTCRGDTDTLETAFGANQFDDIVYASGASDLLDA